MSSNSSFSDSSDSVSNISFPDVTKLKPYDFEPEASTSEDGNSISQVIAVMNKEVELGMLKVGCMC